jgi:anaerobic magnesium-protoporphyrin IX monomethyl ester cyclase
MDDILLLFAPQWSPFQPPLSLPSLTAWLRRAGYSVSCVDANILLYRWFFSDDFAMRASHLIAPAHLSPSARVAYRSILGCREEFRRDLETLKESEPDANLEDRQRYVQKHYLAIKAFNSYLASISEISGDFSISPYDFQLSTDSQESPTCLESFANSPPPILNAYTNWLLENYILPRRFRVVGLSCIGEEQLPFTLLLGKTFKNRFPDRPVLVGGTILSRIFERNVLKPEWFQEYFDVIVRNEGEKPCELLLANLRNGYPLTQDVPGIVYLSEGNICSTRPSEPLKPAEVPIPDFDDLPLSGYISSETTLPLLSSRGCYWGKCEFCHHYMVYGDRYSPYDVGDMVNTIETLSKKYRVRHFAFNDEAIPPKVITALGRVLPDHKISGLTFTGLIKFEKYFKREHFENLSRVGFRSLYIGLESASERVLTLMRKPNEISTIKNNLQHATESGIWTHCFLFFGFPGETEEDAQKTFDFITSKSHIIGSFGCGTFVLEHNAPIQRHVKSFGLTILDNQSSSGVSVYYDYSVDGGITKQRAKEWMERLNRESLQIDKYRATTWIPREFLLCLISRLTPSELVNECVAIDLHDGLPVQATVSDVASLVCLEGAVDECLVVNRMSRKVASARKKMVEVFKVSMANGMTSFNLASMNSQLAEFLTMPIRPAAPVDSQLPIEVTSVGVSSAASMN